MKKVFFIVSMILSVWSVLLITKDEKQSARIESNGAAGSLEIGTKSENLLLCGPIPPIRRLVPRLNENLLLCGPIPPIKRLVPQSNENLLLCGPIPPIKRLVPQLTDDRESAA